MSMPASTTTPSSATSWRATPASRSPPSSTPVSSTAWRSRRTAASTCFARSTTSSPSWSRTAGTTRSTPSGSGAPRRADERPVESQVELVAQTAHGDEVLGLARVGLDLGAQPLHVDVQRLGVSDVVGAPHPVDELTAGEHPAGVAQEHLQQLELLEREPLRGAVDRDDVALDVHPDGSGLERGRREVGLLPATQHGADPRHQLARRVRLGDVVVGAELETDDLVDLVVLRADHDHRHARGLPDLAADLGARDAGQHHVEEHDVGPVAVELHERGVAVRGDRDLEALLAEHVGERLAVALFVLYDE